MPRHASWADFPKRRVHGRWRCRWCGRPCTGRRENFCSAGCAVEVAVRCERVALRHYIRARDHGICTDCDLDTEWLREELDTLRRTDRAAWLKQVGCLGFTRKEALRSLWQADHVIPVVQTGPVGLDAVETRCTRCHKVKTRGEAMTTKPVKKSKALLVLTPTRFREKGLWLSVVSVRVEDVTARHKTPCIACGQAPTDRRLKVARGAGRGAVTEVYCIACGILVLNRLTVENGRALTFLLKGVLPDGGAIRVADTLFERVKAVHKKREEARAQRREALGVAGGAE